MNEQQIDDSGAYDHYLQANPILAKNKKSQPVVNGSNHSQKSKNRMLEKDDHYTIVNVKKRQRQKEYGEVYKQAHAKKSRHSS